MLETFRSEDDDQRCFILRRVIHHAECQNRKCGVTVTTVMPVMIKKRENLK